VVELSDAKGKLVESYRYSPYGESYGPGASGEAQDTELNPIRFTGQYLDSESDLYNMRAREYAPETGAFLQTDPLEADSGALAVGAYVYVGDQPTVMTDPSGERGAMGAGWIANCFVSSVSSTGAPRSYHGNGCGPGGWKKNLIPNAIPAVFDFKDACNNHDWCYGQKYGTARRTCDNNFLSDMNSWCDEYATGTWTGWARHKPCLGYAQVYYNAVRGWRSKIKITRVGPTITLPASHIGRDVYTTNQLAICPYKKKGKKDIARCKADIASRAS
jgi:RHS repeat-associated protein